MERNFRVVRACASEAVRDFHWREYAPFGWMFAGEFVFLLLALNLASPIGMGTVGNLTRLMYGDGALHFPRFFLILPSLASWVEGFLYTIPGALLIPLSLIRIMAPVDRTLANGHHVWQRLRQAFLPTLLASITGALLLAAWQWTLERTVASTIRGALPGVQGPLAIWGLSILGAYVIGALFLYVPVAAVRPGTTLGQALREGMHEGVGMLGWTILFIMAFALPALPFLLVAQLFPAFVAEKMRPELIAAVVAMYAVVISIASYLTYAAAARLHLAGQVEEQS